MAGEEESKGARKLPDEERAELAGEIPLPPEDLRAELDNSGESEGAGDGTQDGKAGGGEPAARPEVADLDFLHGEPVSRIELAFPFRHDGQEIREITVEPLTVQQTADVIARAGAEIDNFDLYAAMTGLPAPVLRALRGDDGERVTGACYGFLPPWRKGVA